MAQLFEMAGAHAEWFKHVMQPDTWLYNTNQSGGNIRISDI